ncbi:hypothetical protein OEZ86_012661 [Tetradesmus obliquus]|nr:hypothetical protein OEZ86_012661 [Tetradesmus obliquus]
MAAVKYPSPSVASQAAVRYTFPACITVQVCTADLPYFLAGGEARSSHGVQRCYISGKVMWYTSRMSVTA